MNPKRLALIHFTCFAILIGLGVWVKRMMGHPEYVIFFHLPAAVFLVLWGFTMKQARTADYDHEVALIRARLQSSTQPAPADTPAEPESNHETQVPTPCSTESTAGRPHVGRTNYQ